MAIFFMPGTSFPPAASLPRCCAAGERSAREDNIYEMSTRQVVVGPALLQPPLLAEVVIKWLEDLAETEQPTEL
jgi:hypothetical protein